MGIGCSNTRHCRLPVPRWAALLLGQKERNVLRGGCFLAATVTASHAPCASRAREPWESLVFLLLLIPSSLGHQSPLLDVLLSTHLRQLRDVTRNCPPGPQGLQFAGKENLLWKGKRKIIVMFLDTRIHQWADLAASCLSFTPEKRFSSKSKSY